MPRRAGCGRARPGGRFRAMDAVQVSAVKRSPSRAALLTEPPRAGLDLAALAATWPLLATARRGDGHPVLVLPGLMTGDPATIVLRTALRALGHNVSGWSLGLHRGPTGRVVQRAGRLRPGRLPRGGLRCSARLDP